MSESPGKSLCTTMISPTQVVLGRPTPYFVPSGERSQGPIINQNATPEHIPEPEKVKLFYLYVKFYAKVTVGYNFFKFTVRKTTAQLDGNGSFATRRIH